MDIHFPLTDMTNAEKRKTGWTEVHPVEITEENRSGAALLQQQGHGARRLQQRFETRAMGDEARTGDCSFDCYSDFGRISARPEIDAWCHARHKTSAAN